MTPALWLGFVRFLGGAGVLTLVFCIGFYNFCELLLKTNGLLVSFRVTQRVFKAKPHGVEVFDLLGSAARKRL